MTFRHGQCKAIAKSSGKRCSVGAKDEGGFCGPHTDHAPVQIVEKTTPEQKEISLEEGDEMFWSEIHSKFNLVVSGTGSRSLQTASTEEANRVLDWVINRPAIGLKALKEQHGNIVVMSGLAEGFDAALAYAALKLEIPLIAAIPSPSYGEYYWRDNSVTGKDRYDVFKKYRDNAMQVIYVCTHHEWGGANKKRNAHMVEHGDVFFVYDKESRGTAHAFSLIQKAGKPHHIIPMEGGDAR